MGVGPEKFHDVAARGDVAEVRVHVESGDGLLAVPGDGGWARPGGVVDVERSLEAAAEELVRRQTGIDCSVEELLRVSLVCLQCEASGEAVWELGALFGAAAESGTPVAGAAWRDGLPESSRAL